MGGVKMMMYLFMGDSNYPETWGIRLVMCENVDDAKDKIRPWMASMWMARGRRWLCQWLVGLNVGSLGAEETEALGSSHCEARGRGCRDISTNQQS